MADNTYETKLVISADTSDAEKKLKEVGKTKVDPVKVDVVADKVKIDTTKVEQQKPVKVEAKAEKVYVEVEDAEAKRRIEALTEQDGIKKIRVVTEDGKLASRAGGKETFEITVDAEKAKKTIDDLKADNRITFKAEVPTVKPKVEQPKPVKVEAKTTKIKVEVSDDEAKKKLQSLTADGIKTIKVVTKDNALATRKNGRETFIIEADLHDDKARQQIEELCKDRSLSVKVDTEQSVSAIGKINKAVSGVGAAIALVSRTLGWIGLAISGVQALVKAFDWLKDKMSESYRTAAKLNFDSAMSAAAAKTKLLCDMHERLNKFLKDELDTLSKQNALDKVDKQGKKDYEDGRRAADRARQLYEAKTPEEEKKLRDRFAEEDVQLERKAKKDARNEEIKRIYKEQYVYEATSESSRQKIGETKSQIEAEKFNLKRANGNKNEEAKIKKRIDDLNSALKEYEKLFEEMTKKAEFNREMINKLREVRDYNGESVEYYQRKQEEKTKARESEKDDRDWKDRRKRESDKKTVDESVESEKNTGNKKAILDAQAHNARQAAEKLRTEYEAEMKKDAGSRDYEKISDLRGKIDAFESDAESYARRAKDIDKDERTRRAADLESFAERAASVEGVSQNRLTAMGLGSGVTSSNNVASDVRRLVDLLKQNVDATKNIKIEQADPVGVYGE